MSTPRELLAAAKSEIIEVSPAEAAAIAGGTALFVEPRGIREPGPAGGAPMSGARIYLGRHLLLVVFIRVKLLDAKLYPIRRRSSIAPGARRPVTAPRKTPGEALPVIMHRRHL